MKPQQAFGILLGLGGPVETKEKWHVSIKRPRDHLNLPDFLSIKSMNHWLVVSTHLKNESQIGSFPRKGEQKYLKPPPRSTSIEPIAWVLSKPCNSGIFSSLTLSSQASFWKCEPEIVPCNSGFPSWKLIDKPKEYPNGLLLGNISSLLQGFGNPANATILRSPAGFLLLLFRPPSKVHEQAARGCYRSWLVGCANPT